MCDKFYDISKDFARIIFVCKVKFFCTQVSKMILSERFNFTYQFSPNGISENSESHKTIKLCNCSSSKFSRRFKFVKFGIKNIFCENLISRIRYSTLPILSSYMHDNFNHCFNLPKYLAKQFYLFLTCC